MEESRTQIEYNGRSMPDSDPKRKRKKKREPKAPPAESSQSGDPLPEESGITNSGTSGEELPLGESDGATVPSAASESEPGSESETAPTPRATLKQLLRSLRKGNGKARAKAARELGAMGSAARKAVPYLAKAVADDEELVRYRAVRALGQIGPDAVRGVPALVRALNEGSKDRTRDAKSVSGAAARSIKRVGPAAVPHLLTALEVDALRRRVARLLRALKPTNSPEEREAMAELLALESPRPAVAAVDALEDHGASGVFLLLQAAGDGPPEVSRRAMHALRAIGKPAVTALAKALNDDRATVRACAAASLSDIARKVSQRPVSRMIHRLKDATTDGDPLVRNAAVEALSQLTDYEDRVLPPLVAALGDKVASVSLQAVMAVLKVGSDRDEIAELMIDVLEGRRSSDYCRVGACMVLMHLGADGKAAVPTLVEALEDKAAEVREYAHLALNAIRTPSMRLNVIRTASMRLKVVDEPKAPKAPKPRRKAKKTVAPKKKPAKRAPAKKAKAKKAPKKPGVRRRGRR